MPSSRKIVIPTSHTTLTSWFFSSESVVGLTSPDSYQLLRMPTMGDPVSVEGIPDVASMPHQENAVMVAYTGIPLEVATVRETSGFTLGRANSEVMNDLSGNNPIGLSDDPSDNIEILDSAGVRSERAMARTRAPSSNARLINLTISTDELMPMFSSPTTVYTTVVPNATTSVTVIPTASHSGARIVVNGIEVMSGMSREINVSKGLITTVKIMVIAQDGMQMPYTIEVNRRPFVIRVHTRVLLEGLER